MDPRLSHRANKGSYSFPRLIDNLWSTVQATEVRRVWHEVGTSMVWSTKPVCRRAKRASQTNRADCHEHSGHSLTPTRPTIGMWSFEDSWRHHGEPTTVLARKLSEVKDRAKLWSAGCHLYPVICFCIYRWSCILSNVFPAYATSVRCSILLFAVWKLELTIVLAGLAGSSADYLSIEAAN
ncbi:hypothetical protein AUEXF2481DRAFT_32045 [Aureobasidium subglaciale EXF-2481]|uniref:Uncharacterized protein n=1 Tax=Aureobasidium subglaciale (strain EXF-2481) TaxID=1043005 RepID=A0A074YE95_AURSE|nr:uncharacterized protein AUEXF2481DRAFT_32045 [Aureobasidium subglaciale EXF-2481]KEQ92447.1 hypothetical protein AUEXF2481DRAFT_32045 [Aureobasidium subglaciale EXF-2481]